MRYVIVYFIIGLVISIFLGMGMIGAHKWLNKKAAKEGILKEFGWETIPNFVYILTLILTLIFWPFVIIVPVISKHSNEN